MNAGLYYEHLHLTLDRGYLEEVFALWRESVYLGTFGVITRAVIAERIPELAKHYNMEVTEETTFREFIDAYYEKEYSEQCSEVFHKPFKCIEYFASTGNRELLKLAIKKVREIPALQYDTRSLEQQIQSHALQGAARGGQIELIVIFFEGVKKSLEGELPIHGQARARGAFAIALSEAIEEGRLEVVKFLLELGVISEGKDLQHAARKNDREMIQLLFDYGNKELVHGQRGASEGGHTELRRFFSRKLAGMDAEL